MRKADNLPPSCAAVTKSGNLNFKEPSGPVQGCNGTALPLLLCAFVGFVTISNCRNGFVLSPLFILGCRDFDLYDSNVIGNGSKD